MASKMHLTFRNIFLPFPRFLTVKIFKNQLERPTSPPNQLTLEATSFRSALGQGGWKNPGLLWGTPVPKQSTHQAGVPSPQNAREGGRGAVGKGQQGQGGGHRKQGTSV